MEKIHVQTHPQKDTLQEDPKVSARWMDVSETMMPYDHPRPLTNGLAQKAVDYISVIVRQYPFQLRYAMALPLWERFAETWCETGDEQKSLRAI